MRCHFLRGIVYNDMTESTFEGQVDHFLYNDIHVASAGLRFKDTYEHIIMGVLFSEGVLYPQVYSIHQENTI